MIRQRLAVLSRPVGRGPSPGRHLISFREKIGVVGRSRVGERWKRSFQTCDQRRRCPSQVQLTCVSVLRSSLQRRAGAPRGRMDMRECTCF
jgi:hypothetical protein